MNSKALTLAGISLALAVVTYAGLNYLYPFKQAVEVVKPAATAEQVYSGTLDSNLLLAKP